jgi:hypothetical protein
MRKLQSRELKYFTQEMAKLGFQLRSLLRAGAPVLSTSPMLEVALQKSDFSKGRRTREVAFQAEGTAEAKTWGSGQSRGC